MRRWKKGGWDLERLGEEWLGDRPLERVEESGVKRIRQKQRKKGTRGGIRESKTEKKRGGGT